MTESGVIPRPSERRKRKPRDDREAGAVGFVTDADGATVRVGFDGGMVTIGGAAFPAQARLSHEQREDFARLFHEATRQADKWAARHPQESR